MDNSSNQPSKVIIILKLNVVPTFFHLVFINICICGYNILIWLKLWLKLPYMCMLIKCYDVHILGNFEVVGIGQPIFVGGVTLHIAIDLNH
jgi:hypothetical protein